MCIQLSVLWKCKHFWTGLITCTYANENDLKETPRDCPLTNKQLVYDTPHRQYKDPNLVLCEWACSPHCCFEELKKGIAKYNEEDELLKSQDWNVSPREYDATRHRLKDAADSVTSNMLEVVNVGMPRLLAGLGISNIMRAEVHRAPFPNDDVDLGRARGRLKKEHKDLTARFDAFMHLYRQAYIESLGPGPIPLTKNQSRAVVAVGHDPRETRGCQRKTLSDDWARRKIKEKRASSSATSTRHGNRDNRWRTSSARRSSPSPRGSEDSYAGL